MAMCAEHRSKSAMVTSPYEWKILEWDEKTQTNKTNRFASFFTFVICLYLVIAIFVLDRSKKLHPPNSVAFRPQCVCWDCNDWPHFILLLSLHTRQTRNRRIARRLTKIGSSGQFMAQETTPTPSEKEWRHLTLKKFNFSF